MKDKLQKEKITQKFEVRFANVVTNQKVHVFYYIATCYISRFVLVYNTMVLFEMNSLKFRGNTHVHFTYS